MNNLISVMGTLGIGKTTYASFIAERLGFGLVIENYQENPFLPLFYENMKRWAFHSQTFFLLEKVRQLEDISVSLENSSIIQDTPIFQDVYSYALAQHKLGNMNENEWLLYTKLYNSLIQHIPKPNMIVYLDASIDTIASRIESRGRSFEKTIPLTYISLLNDLNKTLIQAQKHIPTVFIDCNTVDIVNSEKDKEQVLTMIENALPHLKTDQQFFL